MDFKQGNYIAQKKQPCVSEKIVTVLAVLCLIFAVLTVSYLLYNDDCNPGSIGNIWHFSHHYSADNFRHLLALGLMPLYVGIMIFGGAFFALFFSRYVFSGLLRKKNKNKSS